MVAEVMLAALIAGRLGGAPKSPGSWLGDRPIAIPEDASAAAAPLDAPASPSRERSGATGLGGRCLAARPGFWMPLPLPKGRGGDNFGCPLIVAGVKDTRLVRRDVKTVAVSDGATAV